MRRTIVPEADLNVLAALERLDEKVIGIFRLIQSEHDLTDAKFVTFRTLIEEESKRVELALAASDKAITKSEQSYNDRFTLLNELRSGVATAEQLQSLALRVQDLTDRINRSEGQGVGVKENKAGLYLVLGLGFTLVLVVIAIMNTITGK